MKIIEGMKQIKDLNRKVDDITKMIGVYCTIYDYETPTYEDQRGQVESWLQSVHDLTKEILRLRMEIQYTNIVTPVTIELGGRQVTRTISEWIVRRQVLAVKEYSAWNSLGDKGLKEGIVRQSTGETKEVKIRRFYDPKKRDERKELFASEPNLIDARLEVVNAVTDLQSPPMATVEGA